MSNVPRSARQFDDTCAGPAVYFLAKNGLVVYVGQTGNVKSRIRAHGFPKFSHGRWDAAFFIQASEFKVIRGTTERFFIAELKPQYNYPTSSDLPKSIKKDAWESNRYNRSVSAGIDKETARALVLIEKELEIKPAAVARLGLRAVLPDLVKRAKQIESASK